ncbi:MAG: hypothetical protein ABH887_01475 [bacterium]
MPLFISHISFLKKFWDENQYSMDFFHDAVFGTLLSDIRYITKQNREITHLTNTIQSSQSLMTYNELFRNILERSNSIINISNISSEKLLFFKIGFSFHVVLDKWWSKQIYFPSDFERFGVCLKFMNDILLKQQIDNCKLDLSQRLVYEINFLNIDSEIIKKWYDFVFWYIRKKPTLKNIEEILITSNLFKPVMAKKITEEINEISNNKEIIDKINQIYESFTWHDIKNQFVA